MMVSNKESPFPGVYFQGRAVSFREDKCTTPPGGKCTRRSNQQKTLHLLMSPQPCLTDHKQTRTTLSLSLSHNHGNGKLPWFKGNYYWRNPFSTSMIMEGRVCYRSTPCCQSSLLPMSFWMQLGMLRETQHLKDPV